MKKILVCLLVFTFLCSSLISVNAKEKDRQDSPKSQEELNSMYGLQEIGVSEVPEGITPLEFDTVEEANLYLQSIQSAKETESKEEAMQIQNKITGILAAGTTSTGYTVVQTMCIPSITMNIGVNYTKEYRYTEQVFSAVTGVSSWISGFTLGTEWTQSSYTSYFSSDLKTCYVTVSGILDQYFIVDGIIKIWSWNESYSGSFR